MSASTQAGADSSRTVAYPVPNTNGDASKVQQAPTPPPASKTPVGSGVLTVVGLILAALVIALGVVGVHDALVAAGAGAGRPWIDAVAAPIDGLKPAFWLVPVGIALFLTGLWLLLTALRPRASTAIALQAATGVFLRPRDVATLARNAAQEVDGVISAKVTASPRKITVAAKATTGGVQEDISQAVTTRLGALATAPTIRVNVKTEGG